MTSKMPIGCIASASVSRVYLICYHCQLESEKQLVVLIISFKAITGTQVSDYSLNGIVEYGWFSCYHGHRLIPGTSALGNIYGFSAVCFCLGRRCCEVSFKMKASHTWIRTFSNLCRRRAIARWLFWGQPYKGVWGLQLNRFCFQW